MLCLLMAFSTVSAATGAIAAGSELSVESELMLVGETQKLDFSIDRSTLEDGTVVYQTDDSSIFEITPQGEVKALAQGSARVFATDSSGQVISNEVEINVSEEGSIESFVQQEATAAQYDSANSLYAGEVSLNATSLILGVSESYKLQANITGATGSLSTMQAVAWSSNNPEVLTVDSTGTITAHNLGLAIVTAMLENGNRSRCTIMVKEAPDSISLNKTSLTLGVGETYDLNSSLPSGTASHSVVYTSNNTSVASVKAAGGLVTANKAGTATITATTFNGKTVKCTITVKNAPSSISLNKTSLTLGVGETYDLNSSLPSGTASHSVVYTSNNTSVASVKSGGGLVTANKVGTATVTATTFNGKTVKCTITVKNAPPSISLNKTSLTLGVGETYDLNSSLPSGTASHSVVYTSNNTSVASVKAAGGLVTANKAGTATITATTFNGKTVKCTITVKNAPSKISLNKTSLTLGVGETYDLNSSLPSGTASHSVVYTSNNTSVASVKAAGGLVTAKKTGTATITATTFNGKTVKCTITVKNAPSKISLNKTSLTLGVGETYDLNSSLPSGTASHSVVYTSNNTSVASVKAGGGLVTAKKTGTATITATTFNGKTVKCTVTVKNAPSKISLNKTSLTLSIGETYDLNSSLPSGTASHSVVYTSNNTSVASVKAGGGLVTAKKEGTATITATTYNGKKVTCTVTVKERSYTDDDLFCLAAVIWQEAGSYWISDRVQLMVGNVVLNHVANPLFPDTIRECITRPYAYGTMAWTGVHIPTATDPITKAAIDRCYANAKKLLEGYRILPSNVIYQAGFIQGSGVYAYEGGMYFCYQ